MNGDPDLSPEDVWGDQGLLACPGGVPTHGIRVISPYSEWLTTQQHGRTATVVATNSPLAITMVLMGDHADAYSITVQWNRQVLLQLNVRDRARPAPLNAPAFMRSVGGTHVRWLADVPGGYLALPPDDPLLGDLFPLACANSNGTPPEYLQSFTGTLKLCGIDHGEMQWVNPLENGRQQRLLP